MTREEHTTKIEETFRRDPLVAFSVYTHIQVGVLRGQADEIRSLLDASLANPGIVKSDSGMRAYGLFWLWLLGAYEVVRTMSQARSCFVPSVSEKLRVMKKGLAKLRIPFAKQEYAGQMRPVGVEPSICGWDFKARSMKFCVGSEVVSVRPLMDDFESLFSSITYDDIICDHRDSNNYPRRGATGK
jgi:hypothetical protein